MPWEQRLIWLLKQILDLPSDETKHIVLLAIAIVVCMHWYPQGVNTLGGALLLRLNVK